MIPSAARIRPRRATPHPDTAVIEQQALSIVKGVAASLDQAGQDLDKAAAWLQDAGKGPQANHTKQAAIRAHRDAAGLLAQ